jgi:hypothetical protein
MATARILERRHGLSAPVRREPAAGVESAPLGQGQRARHGARNTHQRLPASRGAVDTWDRAEQTPGVGHPRLAEQGSDRSLLDGPAGIHHHHPVGHLGDDAEVMGDEQDRHPELLLQATHQVEDLGLDGDVEGGGRLVGDQQARIAAQRHGDHHALPHAAGELVRVAARARRRLGDADERQRLDRLRPGRTTGCAPMRDDGFGDLVADRKDGIEAGHRLLEDHRDLVAADGVHLLAGQCEQVAAPIENSPAGDPSGRARHQSHDGEAGDGLARAGFSHHGERLALVEVEADAVDGSRNTFVALEIHAEVDDLEQPPPFSHAPRTSPGAASDVPAQ